MKVAETLREVLSWPLEDRMELVMAIQDAMEDEPESPAGVLSDAQKEELNRRIADYEKNPSDVLTWDEIRAHLRRPR